MGNGNSLQGRHHHLLSSASFHLVPQPALGCWGLPSSPGIGLEPRAFIWISLPRAMNQHQQVLTKCIQVGAGFSSSSHPRVRAGCGMGCCRLIGKFGRAVASPPLSHSLTLRGCGIAGTAFPPPLSFLHASACHGRVGLSSSNSAATAVTPRLSV